MMNIDTSTVAFGVQMVLFLGGLYKFWSSFEVRLSAQEAKQKAHDLKMIELKQQGVKEILELKQQGIKDITELKERLADEIFERKLEDKKQEELKVKNEIRFAKVELEIVGLNGKITDVKTTQEAEKVATRDRISRKHKELIEERNEKFKELNLERNEYKREMNKNLGDLNKKAEGMQTQLSEVIGFLKPKE